MKRSIKKNLCFLKSPAMLIFSSVFPLNMKLRETKQTIL